MGVVAQQQPFQFHKAITPNDSDLNLYGVRYIQNIGSAGLMTIRQSDGYGNVPIYLLQGQSMDTGSRWLGVMATSLGAGVSLVGFE